MADNRVTWTQEEIACLLGRLKEIPQGAKILWSKLCQGLQHSGNSCRQLALRDQSLAAEVRRIHGELDRPQGDSVVIEYDVPEETPIEELWRLAESINSKEVKKAQTQSSLRVDLGTGWKLVSFASDQHTCIGEAVDLQKMREDAELIRDTPGAYVVLVGDGVDNHIKHAAAALHAKSTPNMQYKLFDHYLGILGNKVLAMVTGNHDDWTNDIAGLDMMKFLADKNGIICTKDEAILDVTLGESEYKIAARHQYRMNSSFNQGHAVKRWWELGEVNFDIGCLAHHHQSHFEPFEKHGTQRYAFRPGSYQIQTAHGRRYGFNNSTPTCPCVVIGDHGRDITPFDDLRKGVLFLKALRSG